MRTFLTKLFLLLGLLLIPGLALAESVSPRTYHYAAIEQTYVVNKNSTVDVTETQTFEYVGQFHRGRRWIPIDKLRAIDNISVVDGESLVPLVFSSTTLSKDDPQSWGKYTYYVENNVLRIEWYFNLHDTTHRFTFHYRLHGAAGFYDKYDGLYLDLVTNYEAPIDMLTASIVLPQPVPKDGMSGILYGNAIAPTSPENAVISDGKINFTHRNVAPHEQITIATRWPKRTVSFMSYIQDFLGRIRWLNL